MREGVSDARVRLNVHEQQAMHIQSIRVRH